MAGIVLNVEKREKIGTGGARATRNSGLVPGVLYGGARGSIPIEINAKDVEMAIRSGKFLSHMVELNHQGEKQPGSPQLSPGLQAGRTPSPAVCLDPFPGSSALGLAKVACATFNEKGQGHESQPATHRRTE